MGSFRLGTSGWSYKDWAGPFYPKGTAAGDYLREYAEAFDIVEVDSTYYRTPNPAVVGGWADKTPAGFRFAVKMVNTVTHEKVLEDCEGERDEFLSALAPLGEKLHSVLLQFGYFNKKAFAGPEAFMDRLEKFLEAFPRNVPVAVEIRNKWWLTAAFFELLSRHKAAFCLCDHVWMPSVARVIEEHDVRTGPFVYLRLIGDRKGIEAVTTRWDQVAVDRSERLREIAVALRGLPSGTEIVTFVNNHFAGHAPATVRELAAMMEGLDR